MSEPVFTWSPYYGSPQQSRKPRVLTASYGEGYEQRVADGINTDLATWNLTFRGAPAYTNDIDVFLAARGGVEAFWWTDRRGRVGRYVCRSWTQNEEDPAAWNLVATFEQVADGFVSSSGVLNPLIRPLS